MQKTTIINLSNLICYKRLNLKPALSFNISVKLPADSQTLRGKLLGKHRHRQNVVSRIFTQNLKGNCYLIYRKLRAL